MQNKIIMDDSSVTVFYPLNTTGKKYAHLCTKKFEEGFAKGKGLEETGLTLELFPGWIKL